MKKDISESAKKRKAVDSAISSLKMEGFVFTDEEMKEFNEVVCGRMTLEEHRGKYIEIGRSLGKKGGHV